MRIFVIGAGQVGLDDRRGASRRARRDGVRHRPCAADRSVVSLRRRDRRGQRRQPGDPPRRGHRARGPRHRVHVAGRAEHHRRDARSKARASARRRSSARRTSSTSSSGESASWTSTSSSRPSSKRRTRSRRTIGVPAARQTDVFAEGQVQIVEFDVEEARARTWSGPPLKEAKIPPDSKVASIIRDGGLILPRGVESIRVGDRIVVIGSPAAARAWSSLMTPGGGRSVDDVVIYGAGRAGLAIARMLLGQGIGVRLVEPSASRARLVAEELSERARLRGDGARSGLPRARAHRTRRRPRCSRCATTRRISMRPRSRSSTASASRSRSFTSRLHRTSSNEPASTSRSIPGC